MSEAERLRRLRYKKNRKRCMTAQIVALILVGCLLLLSLIAYRQLDKTYYIDYAEDGDVDYRVYLKENEFYDEEYLESDRSYLSTLIDRVVADFDYKLVTDTQDVEYDYSYGIDARLEILDSTGAPIFDRSYVIKEEARYTKSGANDLSINEQVVIGYDEYNSLAERFTEEFSLSGTTNNLTVTMKVRVIGSSDSFEQNAENEYTVSLLIPLTKKTVQINMTSTVPDGDNKILACKNTAPVAALKNTSVALGIAELVLAVVYVAFVWLTRNHDITYSARVKRLLSSYRSYIQQIESPFNTDGYQVVRVMSFPEMLCIRDTIQSPILMNENEDETMTRFVIPATTSLIYVYDLKVDNYDEIYRVPDDPTDPAPDGGADDTGSADSSTDADVATSVTVEEPALSEHLEPETTESEVTEPEEVAEPEEATEPEATEPEAAEPEGTEPEVTEPEVTEPEEVAEPEEATEPEVTEPEVTEPEVTEPEVTEPEVTEPEATEPEAAEPEATEPEATEPEVTEPEATEPEVTEPEAVEPEEIIIIPEPDVTITTTSVEEAPVEEAPVEEVPVEEVPVEEATVEEAPAVATVSGEADEDFDTDDMDATRIIDGVVVHVRFRTSFMSRLIQATELVQVNYSLIKNKLLSYQGVKARTSWNYESFNKGRTPIAKLNVRGKEVRVYLALDPDRDGGDSRLVYVGDKSRYAKVPLMVRVKGERSLSLALNLIGEVMKRCGIGLCDELPSEIYRMPYESTEALADRGLVKVIYPPDVVINEHTVIEKLNIDSLLDGEGHRVFNESDLEEALAAPTVELEDIDYVDEVDEEYVETEEAPGVEVIGVVWPERAKRNKIYRYDPSGEILHDGDVVLVPTKDVARNRDVIRKATVAHGNHKIDPEALSHPLKKIISVVKRRLEDVLSGS